MLERIFLSVLSTSLVTSLIIIILIILAPLINRRYAAKWKYWAWILLALRLIMPFSLSDVQNASGNSGQSLSAGAKQYEDNAVSQLQPEGTPGPSQRIILEIPSGMTEPLVQSDRTIAHITPLTILECIWIIGSIIFLSVHLCSYLAYKRLVRLKGVRIKEQTALELLRRLSDELQLKKPITVIEYSGAGSPMVLGFIHPVLVLPAEDYSDEELYFIFKHELIHYKRHDVCLKLLFVLANAVHWFNPVIWLMQREAVMDMELSCDERVMLDADYTARKTYTEILFSILHNKYTNKTPLSTQFYGGKQVMEKRFRNILEHSGKRSGLSILVCTLGLVMGLGFLIGCSVSESDRLEKTSAEEDTLVGIVADSVDVPDVVPDHEKEFETTGIIASSEEPTFSCGMPGCTLTEEHQHGLCGIDGCTEIGEHTHDICNIADCTETGTHIHNGEYCYPHSADDGHAYHDCGVPGCTEVGSHTHNSCGVSGCTQIGEHSHGGNDGGHHQSGHH